MAADPAQFHSSSALLEELDALSRTRRLTADESRRLERALRRLPHTRAYKRWTKAEIDRLRRYLKRGKKPREIAILMSMNERAIWQRIYKLNWSVAALCPEHVATPSRLRARG